MAIKRQHNTMSMFSMASMTDVIFLLLIFFMVTSTFVFPSAMEVNLPQSSQTTTLKPTSRIYIDSIGGMYYTIADSTKEGQLQPIAPGQLDRALATIKAVQQQDQQFVALYADKAVTYGTLVDVLDKGAKAGIKIVLATKPGDNNVAENSNNEATAQNEAANDDGD